ncbi:MAG: GTPase HflX [Verrucomicrobiales bacterium]|nr:GTPase HflX [Verrucomicrobiales bacterium]
MFDIREKPDMVERAFLIGAYFRRDDEAEAASLLEELEELVRTLDIGIVESHLVFIRDQSKRYLTGSGKAEELMQRAKELKCDAIVFDNELSPSQQRNWESESDVCVLDREEVILDIFAMRARTREAALQVQLARMRYSLPRLAKMWTHLDRQGGGSGGGKGGAAAARGEGEKQIEVDRRLARKRISMVEKELDTVRTQRATQRKERTREGLPHAAIVGYTNAGKSSLLNRLADADILVEDKLFATLDPTTRRIELPDGQALLLTDTVGFVRNLPHRLVEAFKATLEESVLADFLIHVLDASAENAENFYQTTLDVLRDLGAEGKPMVLAINKIDLLQDDADGLQRLHELRGIYPEACFVSVKTGEGIEELILRVNELNHDRVSRLELRIPQARQDLMALLHRDGKILEQGYEGNDILLTAIVPKAQLHHFNGFDAS